MASGLDGQDVASTGGDRAPAGVREPPGASWPSRRASRLPRARLDTRLLLGVLLVLLAVVLGARCSRRGRRVEVWSVTRDLGSDTVLTSDDVAVAAVRLDEAAGPTSRPARTSTAWC